jgi:hypothetical protein
VSEVYSGRQFVGMDLHRRRSVLVRMTEAECYHVAFNSATLEAAGYYMAEVQLEYIQQDGTKATSPDRFNVATFWLDEAGSPPNPASGCS